jgi:hypothetical protein
MLIKPVFDSEDSSDKTSTGYLIFVRHLLAPKDRLFYNSGLR